MVVTTHTTATIVGDGGDGDDITVDQRDTETQSQSSRQSHQHSLFTTNNNNNNNTKSKSKNKSNISSRLSSSTSFSQRFHNPDLSIRETSNESFDAPTEDHYKILSEFIDEGYGLPETNEEGEVFLLYFFSISIF